MAGKAFFTGLIFDENDVPVETVWIGNESFYVVDDSGFKRHIESREVDEKIIRLFTDQIEGNEDYLANAAANMSGKTDLFSIAMIKNQLKNIDKEIDALFRNGPPAGMAEILGMSGFRVTIDIHGNIVEAKMPSRAEDSDE